MDARMIIPNLFIIEGGEGVGKTTIAKRLAETIPNAEYLRDPGGNPLCEKIRDVILENGMCKYTEMFLFLASRATLYEEEILPRIRAGKIVIMDRLHYSNLVYQGIVRGCGIDKVLLGNKWIMEGYSEAAVFLLDMDTDEALARCANRGDNNRLDRMNLDFHRKIRQGYLDVCEGKENSIVVDATDGEAAFAKISSYIMSHSIPKTSLPIEFRDWDKLFSTEEYMASSNKTVEDYSKLLMNVATATLPR